MRRILAVAAMLVFAALGLAVPANAYTPYPPDCSVTHPVVNGSPVYKTDVMTCTGRSATEHWHLYVDCFGPWLDSAATGNSVVGNGSSTASCPWGYAQDPTFVPEP